MIEGLQNRTASTCHSGVATQPLEERRPIRPRSPPISSCGKGLSFGHKASFNKDENLIIVKGQRNLAEAYATHVLDVYDHFSWRWMVQRDDIDADTSLKVDPDELQSRYFNEDGGIKNAQLRFWLSALPAA